MWLSMHAIPVFFTPAVLAPRFPVSRFPPLQSGAAFSSLAFSNLAFLTVPPFPFSRFQSPPLQTIQVTAGLLKSNGSLPRADCPETGINSAPYARPQVWNYHYLFSFMGHLAHTTAPPCSVDDCCRIKSPVDKKPSYRKQSVRLLHNIEIRILN